MEKKRILIVNNNMQMGGIQKSLLNLLIEICKRYDVTLMLFSAYGDLLTKIPSEVKIVFASKSFEILGTPWKELKRKPLLALHKITVSIINKVFGKKVAFKAISIFQRKIKGYTHVISFSHCTSKKHLSVCTPEFVINCVDSSFKICYIHCDYANSDTAGEYNNNIYRKFNLIACCSASVRERFLSIIPDVREKTVVARNFYDLSVVEQASHSPYDYDQKYINIISVSRLSREKGVFRAIKSIHMSNCPHIRYYIIGDGPERADIEKYISENHLETQILLVGEQLNPYRFMKNADYLLVPSYHEAAPMEFDEANIPNLKIISTDTTSAREMLSSVDDIIVDNFDAQFWANLKKSDRKKQFVVKNEIALKMFLNMLKEY